MGHCEVQSVTLIGHGRVFTISHCSLSCYPDLPSQPPIEEFGYMTYLRSGMYIIFTSKSFFLSPPKVDVLSVEVTKYCTYLLVIVSLNLFVIIHGTIRENSSELDIYLYGDIV